MKSKTEIILDKELEKLGIRPRIYHFREHVVPFNAITVAVQTKKLDYKGIAGYMQEYRVYAARWTHNRATVFLREMTANGFPGVAICDEHDQFNRRRGRIIAKGRLLKFLKEHL